jgi:hypothetical protein
VGHRNRRKNTAGLALTISLVLLSVVDGFGQSRFIGYVADGQIIVEQRLNANKVHVVHLSGKGKANRKANSGPGVLS